MTICESYDGVGFEFAFCDCAPCRDHVQSLFLVHNGRAIWTYDQTHALNFSAVSVSGIVQEDDIGGYLGEDIVRHA
jgi:hypothetical protein